MNFKQWLEDCGAVYSQLNGKEYADKGVRSKTTATDVEKFPVSNKPQKLFGIKK